MNVSMTPELERFIADQVGSGSYRSASEVVRDAVRLLQAKLEEREAKLDVLRKAVEVGLVELDGAEGISAEGVFKDLLERLNRSEAA
jgi:antitoxin ParD1/3/4